jgi:anti-anti-sigma factor
MSLDLETYFFENVYIIQCSGRIVAGDEHKSLEVALELGAQQFHRMVLYLHELDRLDSTGLGLLVRYAVRDRKRGGDLRFAAPPAFVVDLLQLTMLSSLLEVYPTEKDAIISFSKRHSIPPSPEKRGTQVLVMDEVADMCVFITAVLKQHGFDVKSAGCLHDAKILLEAQGAEYIVVGPNAPQLPSEVVLGSLKAVAPKAYPLQLGADFKRLTALEATTRLLQMFAG